MHYLGDFSRRKWIFTSCVVDMKVSFFERKSTFEMIEESYQNVRRILAYMGKKDIFLSFVSEGNKNVLSS